jgi:hypothetical protein
MRALIVLALWISGDLKPDPPAATAVYLRVDQDAGLADGEVRVILGEIGRIWRPAGVHVSSGRYGDLVPVGRMLVSVRIVTLRPTSSGRHVLGFVTADMHEQPIPTIFISLPAVQDLLNKSVALHPPVLRDRLIAQAMGRVAAHELGHYFMGRTHDQHGLMRPVYSTNELLTPSLRAFAIPQSEHAALRAAVASAIPPR